MYYSKNTGATITLPQNYSGNAFRVQDESDRARPPSPTAPSIEESIPEAPPPAKEDCTSNASEHSHLSSLISSISVEDLLLLGIIFVIHQSNLEDPTLLLLLILLLVK